MQTLITTIPAPELFDLHLTAGHQTHYRGVAGADVYRDAVYSRALRRGNRVVIATVQSIDGADPATLEIGVMGEDVTQDDMAYATQVMARLLGMDIDLSGFYSLLERDPVLSSAVGSLYGLRPPGSESVFEALVIAIIGQQISSVVARVIREALVGTYGTPVNVDGETLYAFPTPKALLEAGTDGLRAVKLSARKAEYILDVALRVADGSLDEVRLSAMSDDDVVSELVKVRGIGVWTAQWVLLRALGRTDAFPAGDLALKRVVSDLYFEGAPLSEQALTDFAMERWSPHRGLATTYLFAYIRQQRLAREQGASKAIGDAAL
ncbi:MAG: DNA-3-methyladenine glycosylase [Chloroflexi bacterium]|nr:DNA-3-methyladenine glycosylase [Chloroflexota bacterium]